MLAVQYLEDGPGVARIPPQEAADRLRQAFALLPVSHVLIGWHLPDSVLGACAEETARARSQLFLWHPLLSGSATLQPLPEWRAIGLDGAPVPAFQGMPEFTFLCPNRPDVRSAVLAQLESALSLHDYQGVFLDRIRYPSPTEDPGSALACFCADCRTAARGEGLDLQAVGQAVRALTTTPRGALSFVRVLLDRSALEAEDPNLELVRRFLGFRKASVTRLVRDAAAIARRRGSAVGLDCFSPSLAPMVGQDLGALDKACDWIKVMTYGHALAPAGLPHELLNLADWLVTRRALDRTRVLDWLSAASRLPLGPTAEAVRKEGLPPEALASELRRARSAGVRTLLAGIELVEIGGGARLQPEQITADLKAFQSAGVDGLVLSWDLRRIPLDRLALVRRVWAAG
jgi:hypothetical protein